MKSLIILIILLISSIFTLKKLLEKKKSKFQKLIVKGKIIFVLLVTGALWCPLTVKYCVSHPAQAIYYSGRLTYCGLKIKNRFCEFDNTINNKIDP